jgi:PAS domain S-box-containing protein
MEKVIEDLLLHQEDFTVILNGSDFRVLRCSTPFLFLIRKREEECIGMTVMELFDLAGDSEWEKHTRDKIATQGMHVDHSISKEYKLIFTPVRTSSTDLIVLRVIRKKGDPRLIRHSQLIENNVAGMFQSNTQGILIDCNRAFAEILGYSGRNEMIGIQTRDFYYSSTDRSTFIKALRGAGRLMNFEITLRRRDGAKIYCLENTYLNRDEEGEEIITGTIVDITPQKLADEAIHESEERLAALASVSHEAVVFLEEDVIVDCNDQFALLFEYINSREIVGSRITDFLSATDVKKLVIAMDVSSTNKTEIRAFSRTAQPLVLEISGIYIKLRGKVLRVFVIADVTARKKAEFTLEQTVVRLRNVLENAPNAIIITTDGFIKYSNQSALKILGVNYEDDLYDRDFLSYVAGVYVEEMKTDFEFVAEGGVVDYKEIKVVGKDGTEVDVGINSTLTVFENRPSVQISLTNISERVQLIAEQMRVRIIEEINTVLKKEIEEHKITQLKLVEQERYTRNLIESSLDMIIACDCDYRITDFNKAAEQQFGLERGQVIGQDLEVLFAKKTECDQVKDDLKAKGEYFGDARNIRKNGEVFQSLLSVSMIRDRDGEVIGSMGVARDISEYRANERIALEQKAKLESIFNSTENMMMWTMDRNYSVTTFNSNFSHWLSDSLGEQIEMGENVFSILRKHVDQNLYQNQLDAMEIAFSGRHQQFELALQTSEEKTIWLQMFLNPVYLDGVQEEVSCLVYDTTDRKTIERKIREALKEKEVLLQEIHHRVKNNLQVISSILNLQSSYVQDPATLEILQESQNRIKSMSFIHETLYRTSDFSSINFSEYLRTLSNNLIQTYGITKNKVSFYPNLDDVTIHIDQAIPCGLIVNELISNSLKYAFEGRERGDLFLDLQQSGTTITLRVADNGVGLPDGFRYEKTDSLGVQLVYTLTEQLDGTIRVTSKPEKGTEFLVTFEML